MNQHSLSAAFVAGLVVTTLCSIPDGALAAAKSASKSALAVACESQYQRTRPAPKVVDKVLQAHARWLEDREATDGRRANLCRADLRQLRLTGAILERVNLEGALLKGANLRNANLVQAHLKGADLSHAILDDAIRQ